MNWTIEEATAAQDVYCDSHDCPRFAPQDGYCFACGRNIFQRISPRRAVSKLITNYPWCNKSFVE